MKIPVKPFFRLGRLATGTLCFTVLLGACAPKPEAMLESARQYLAKDDNKAAIIQIKNALQADPNLPQARLLLGQALLDSGDAVGAETELRKALALKLPQEAVVPALARAMLAQGHAKKLTEEFANLRLTEPAAQADLQVTLVSAFTLLDQGERADQLLQAALQHDPTFAPAQLEQARRTAARGDAAAAQTALDAVLAKAPNNFEAWKLKGDIATWMQHQPAVGQAAYRKALAIKPNQPETRTALVVTLLQQKDLAGASQELAPLQKAAPNHPNTRYLEALLAYYRRDFASALSLAQQSLSGAPGNMATLQLAGALELQMQHLPQAQAYLSQVVEAVPGMLLARRLLVYTYLRQNDPVRALQTLQPALHPAPLEPGLAALAGEVYLRNGQLDQADAYYRQASLQQPDDGRLRTSQVLVKMMRNPGNSGLDELQGIAETDTGTSADMALINTLVQRRAYDQALTAIAALEKKQPGQPTAPFLRARVQLAMNNQAAARTSLERAVSLDARYFPAVAALAALDMADKRPQDARKRLEAVLQKDPKHVPAMLALAEVAGATGASKDEVVKLIGNAVTANPNDVAARLQLVDFYLRNQEPKGALTAAQAAMAALPKEPRIVDALGRSQHAVGDNNQALATYRKLAELMPQSPLAYWRMANIQLVAKDKEGSIQSLRKALAVRPDFLEAQRALIGLYLSDKRQTEAMELARQVKTQRPHQDIGYLLEADIHASAKDWDKATAVLRTGQKQATSTQQALKLHSFLMAGGQTAEAEKVAAQWQKDHPKDAAFVFYLGDRAMERQDFASAEQIYGAVLKLQPDNAMALNNLAWVGGKLKRDTAIGYAERAVALAPDQPAFLDTLAGLREDKGDHAQALELQTRALKMQPQNPLIKLHLARIQLHAGQKDQARQSLDELSKLGDTFSAQGEVAALRKEAAQP